MYWFTFYIDQKVSMINLFESYGPGLGELVEVRICSRCFIVFALSSNGLERIYTF